jgi:hypothetical protein
MALAALDFPNTPAVGDTFVAGNVSWQWDGAKWIRYPGPGASGGGSLPDAPSDTHTYGRKGGAWVAAVNDGGDTMTGPLLLNADPTTALGAVTKQYVDASSAAAPRNVGRNFLHNSLYRVQQRGPGGVSTNAVTADRWWNSLQGSATISTAIVTLTDTDRAAIGDEAAEFGLQSVVVGSATPGSSALVRQGIEDVHRTAGKTVTISFWAMASAALNIGVGCAQSFGTGGSPSATYTVAGRSVAVGTSWARYVQTFALPTAATKVFGTNGDDALLVSLWYAASSDFNTNSGTVGAQSGTFTIWGAQCETGTTATPLEYPDPSLDWQRCQRFLVISRMTHWSDGATGALFGQTVNFPVRMRAIPVIALSGQTYTNASGATVGDVSPQQMAVNATVTTSGSARFFTTYTASAEI